MLTPRRGLNAVAYFNETLWSLHSHFELPAGERKKLFQAALSSKVYNIEYKIQNKAELLVSELLRHPLPISLVLINFQRNSTCSLHDVVINHLRYQPSSNAFLINSIIYRSLLIGLFIFFLLRTTYYRTLTCQNEDNWFLFLINRSDIFWGRELVNLFFDILRLFLFTKFIFVLFW